MVATVSSFHFSSLPGISFHKILSPAQPFLLFSAPEYNVWNKLPVPLAVDAIKILDFLDDETIG